MEFFSRGGRRDLCHPCGYWRPAASMLSLEIVRFTYLSHPRPLRLPTCGASLPIFAGPNRVQPQKALTSKVLAVPLLAATAITLFSLATALAGTCSFICLLCRPSVFFLSLHPSTPCVTSFLVKWARLTLGLPVWFLFCCFAVGYFSRVFCFVVAVFLIRTRDRGGGNTAEVHVRKRSSTVGLYLRC